MTSISLQSAINADLINRFRGLASSSASNSIASALSGGGSKVTISDGLRLGAKTFGTVVKSLNSTVSLFNLSSATMQELGKIVDKAIAVTDQATKISTSQQSRQELDREYRKLGGEFKKIIENAKLGETEYLTKEGLAEVLNSVGLSPEDVSSVAAVFDKFVLSKSDDVLASEEIQGQRPLVIPVSAYTGLNGQTYSKAAEEIASLFDSATDIKKRPDAYAVLADLKALRDQIDDNVKTLDQGLDVIGKNLSLVRAMGLAMLELSDQIESESDADIVAQELRQAIRRDVPGALSQAGNLNRMIVAALASEAESEKTK